MNSKQITRYLSCGVLLFGLVGAAVLTTAGLLWRYGGVDGLRRRVQAELVSYQPRPTALPTLAPQATLDVADFSAELNQLITPAATFTLPAPIYSQVEATSTPMPTIAPTATRPPLPPAVQLTGYTQVWQTWNNCAPATLSTYLSFYGYIHPQAEVAQALKPNVDDKNVSPAEVLAYAETKGLKTQLLINSSAEQVKQFLAQGLPVMVETWLEEHPNDGMGHYRLVVGYDDVQQLWLLSDSYQTQGATTPYTYVTLSYEQFDSWWMVFNRPVLLVYPPQKTAVVQNILGANWSEVGMWQQALADYQQQLQTRPDDPFLWFNLGSVLTHLQQYSAAGQAFDQARTLGLPWRMLWYQFELFEAYEQTGRYNELLELTQATIYSGAYVEEVYIWHGRALQALGREAEAQQAFEQAQIIRP